MLPNVRNTLQLQTAAPAGRAAPTTLLELNSRAPGEIDLYDSPLGRLAEPRQQPTTAGVPVPACSPRPRGAKGSRAPAAAPAQPAGWLRAGVLIGLVGSAAAYPCLDGTGVSRQFFANRERTLYGVVAGQVANCRSETYACGESCYNTRSGVTCMPQWCVEVYVDLAPAHYVDAAMTLIEQHGFARTGWVPTEPLLRIPNPRIEGSLWVSVLVNRFNDSAQLEPSISSLYNII